MQALLPNLNTIGVYFIINKIGYSQILEQIETEFQLMIWGWQAGTMRRKDTETKRCLHLDGHQVKCPLRTEKQE